MELLKADEHNSLETKRCSMGKFPSQFLEATGEKTSLE